jgi:hypothetical protein
MEKNKFDRIAERYSRKASWALWSDNDIQDTSIIEKNLNKLHTKFFIIGLNASKDLINPWSNFHFMKQGSHDYRLAKLFTQDTPFSGSYMTDLFEKIESNGKIIIEELNKMNKKNFQFHANKFNDEIEFVRDYEEPKFILLGNSTYEFFERFTDHRYKNKVCLKHYSARGTTDNWLSESKKLLNSFWEF